jgi:hypothetical protein
MKVVVKIFRMENDMRTAVQCCSAAIDKERENDGRDLWVGFTATSPSGRH